MWEFYDLFPFSNSHIFIWKQYAKPNFQSNLQNPAKPKLAFKKRSNAIKMIHPLNYAHNFHYQQWGTFNCGGMTHKAREK